MISWRRAARDRVYGINRRNAELVYAHNPRENYSYADDKQLCKTHLQAHDIPVPETLALCRGLFELDAILTQLDLESEFVVKPASGSGGDGIVVLGKRVPNGWLTSAGHTMSVRGLRTHLANVVFGAYSKELEDQAIVERRIVPHSFFQELWSDGVCDLRIITLKAQPLLAMIRVPTRRSAGRANLHKGGIGVGVDLQSGMTTAARTGSQILTEHPESKQLLIGRHVPHFADALEIAIATARCVPLGYLGVDIAVDATRGPLVLEVNARPGLEIQNVVNMGLGTALRRSVT